MDSDMKQLLERYWRCETSLDEEARLRDYFAHDEVEPSLMPYKALFTYQREEREIHLGDDFDARVLARLQQEVPTVKARRQTLALRLMPLCRAAAVVALFLSLGQWMQHSFLVADSGEVAVADTIGEQITAPSVAQSGKAALGLDVERTDSLAAAKPLKE